MKILILALSAILLTACDAPQRNRINNAVTPSSNNVQQPTAGSNGGWFNNTTGGATSGSTGGSTAGTTSGMGPGQTRPPGFETCDISQKYFASSINWMGICQSTQDETSVAVNPSVSETIRTCLIPTYKDNAGNSTYLGQPQCYAPVANQVMMGNIYKTRNGFSNMPINGVMVMKEASLGAYYTCMDAFISFTDPRCPQGGNTPIYQQNYPPYQVINCNAMAKALMTTKCNAFKADHPYIDIRLK